MKHALGISLLVTICNAALGCESTSILLVNLETNDLHYCPVGKDSYACIKRLEDLGYIRADRLTPAQQTTLGVRFRSRLIFMKLFSSLLGGLGHGSY